MQGIPQALHGLGDNLPYKISGNRAPIRHSCAVLYPLPDLGTTDLRGGRVFHQVINGHAPGATEPRVQILQTDIDIPAQSRFRDFPTGNMEQVVIKVQNRNTIDLVRPLHVGIENLFGQRHQGRMSHPRTVVAGAHFSHFVVAGLCREPSGWRLHHS